MRLYKVILVLFVSIISIYSLSAKAQVPPALEVPKAVTMEESRQFIDEYIARFMKLDLDPFMGLFSKRGVENRMIPYADIREAYRMTVDGSRSIVYNLKIYSIQTYTESAYVRGRYEIIQTLKRGRTRVLRGDIQWDLVREDGSLKIREVNYGRGH
jgi:hypothetical protein